MDLIATVMFESFFGTQTFKFHIALLIRSFAITITSIAVMWFLVYVIVVIRLVIIKYISYKVNKQNLIEELD